MSRRTPKQLLTVPLDQWNEDEFRDWVVTKAKKAGWYVTVFNKAMVNGRWITPTSTPWVDVCLVRPPRVLMLELKREKHWAWKPGQEPLMQMLQACESDTFEAYKVHPSDARKILRLLARERTTSPGGNVAIPPAEGEAHDG